MTMDYKRKKLHDWIDLAEDKQIDRMFSFAEDLHSNDLNKTKKIALTQEASSDPLFLADIKEIGEDFDAVDE